MTTEALHFKIDGGHLTQLARTRLLEDNVNHAFRIASSLIVDDESGPSVNDAAIGILTGTKKLVGNEKGMRLVKEHTKVTAKYLTEVAYIYAGRIRIKGSWYRPIAYVTNMGRNDMHNEHGMPVNRIGAHRGFSNRAWHYAYANEIVVEHVGYPDPEFPSIKREVIFERCNERPAWHEVPLSPQDALTEFLATGKHLEERSHSEWYGDDYEGGYAELRDDPLKGTVVSKYRKEALAFKAELDLASNIADKAAQEAAEEQIEAEIEASRLRRLDDLKELILKQANGDFVPLTYLWAGEDITVQLPRAPFLHWAFARLKAFEDQLPPWQNISPPGMKMMGDDQYHTDWVIGAGLDPEARSMLYYPGPVNEEALKLAGKMQAELEDTGVTVIVDGAVASGTVVHGKSNTEVPPGSIVILPNLHPRYLKCCTHAAAIITENGGATAHLAQIGRDKLLPMVLVVNALDKFEPGMEVVVNTSSRIVMVL